MHQKHDVDGDNRQSLKVSLKV